MARTYARVAVLRWGPAIAPALISCCVAGAQPAWSGFPDGGSNVSIEALSVFDEDGPGPRPRVLYAASGKGQFTGITLDGVVRWDGWEASLVGEGIGASGLSTGVYEVGGWSRDGIEFQPGLFAGGQLAYKIPEAWKNIARFLPDEWHDVGGGVTRNTITAYDYTNVVFPAAPGAPPDLIVGGTFTHAGGVETESLARWDGTSWHALGEGVSNNSPSSTATVYAMTVFDDDGPGLRPPALYVGGGFYYAGGVLRWNIARWDGQNWEGVGAGLSNTVDALAVYDEDGPGPALPALFAGGTFNNEIGGVPYSMRNIGRWDGQKWTSVGGFTFNGPIKALLVADEDGPGPAKECLFAGGNFSYIPGGTIASGIARWDGTTWTTVGDYGVSGGLGGAGAVFSMAFFDEDGPGPNPGGLYVGGIFGYADNVLSPNIARWGEPLPPKCSPDCDKDADLDLFDFLCFQDRFSGADPWADFERDGDHDLFDFLEFQGQFVSGCP